MTLTLKPTKTGVRFEHSDEDTETSVTIEKTDTDEDMIRKLKRVVALMEGGPSRPQIMDWSAPVQGPEVSGGDVAPPTNGWAAYGPPALPERLKGEVELIQPGEDT